VDGNSLGIKMSKIKDIPKTDQPREKALFYGINSLSNAELLALIISCGTKNHSALEVGYELLSKFNGISGIVKSSVNDLRSVEGINKVKALKLRAAFILYERALEEKIEGNLNIKGRENIALYFKQKISSLSQEKAYVVIVDKRHKVICIRELFKGSQHKLVISPKMVIKEVLDKGSMFYLIHNHPSNICDPSDEDRATTSQIEMLAYPFGVSLIDHLIITKDNYYSLSDNQQYAYSL